MLQSIFAFDKYQTRQGVHFADICVEFLSTASSLIYVNQHERPQNIV